MTNFIEYKGKRIFYEYDEYQDALFLTFIENPGLTYYEELENGVMVRKDVDTDEIVGYTIRNISKKIVQEYLEKAV